MNAVLTRIDSGDQGTFGRFEAPGLSEYSGELPWRDNASMLSCIPEGKYLCTYTWSKHLRKWTYELHGVPGRAGIRLHSANLFGDTTKGYVAQLLGCLSLGEKIGYMNGQKALLVSRPAVSRMELLMERKPFYLEVRHA